MSLQSSTSGSPIVVTMGDPAGISTEITAMAWQERNNQQLSPFFVLSRQSLYAPWKIPVQVIHSPEETRDCFPHALPVIELPDDFEVQPGLPSPESAQMTIQSISSAIDYIKTGQASSVVTNPVNKHVLYQAGFKFPGHTEYLAERAGQWNETRIRPVMMLLSSQLKTVPLTVHIPLNKVSEHITEPLLMRTVRTVHSDMKKYFGLASPRISVAGLNPHAGENGAMGREEIEIIQPAIRALQAEDIDISGPWPADTLFHEKARQQYDVVIGMYHDQALIPIKTLGFDEGVNTTLGLPFVRTSPDHGTAYDIAGKGCASPQSLIEAIKLARKMVQHATGTKKHA